MEKSFSKGIPMIAKTTINYHQPTILQFWKIWWPPRKWTCPLKRDHFKRKFHLATNNFQGIFVSFPEGKLCDSPVHRLWFTINHQRIMVHDCWAFQSCFHSRIYCIKDICKNRPKIYLYISLSKKHFFVFKCIYININVRVSPPWNLNLYVYIYFNHHSWDRCFDEAARQGDQTTTPKCLQIVLTSWHAKAKCGWKPAVL